MTSLIGPSVATLTSKIDAYASANQIDSVANLNGDRVYIYSGTNDITVKPSKLLK